MTPYPFISVLSGDKGEYHIYRNIHTQFWLVWMTSLNDKLSSSLSSSWAELALFPADPTIPTWESLFLGFSIVELKLVWA